MKTPHIDKGLIILYFAAGLSYILIDNYFPGNTSLVIKTGILPILIILFLNNVRFSENRTHLIMLAGLFFSWAGDVVLELNGRIGGLFVAGLSCFLLAHIMYFTVFVLTPGRNVILSKRWYLLIPLIITGLLLTSYLYKDLNEMRLPVILYAAVILTMVAGAINRIEKVNLQSFRIVLAGAILFVFSDASIAVNKFSHPFKASGFVIMLTYIIAQYLIVTGYLRQFRTEYNRP